MFNLVQIIASLSLLLEPFLPFSCVRIRDMLGGVEYPGWRPVCIEGNRRLNDPAILFQRLDKKVAQEEVDRLKANLCLDKN